MISFLSGTVESVSGTTVVLDVAGIGVELAATARCLQSIQVGAVVRIPAIMVVREESWTMYGFADADERACFQALQSAKGVGPRVALNLLTALTPDRLRAAIASGDANALTVASGVGLRGAQRMVIDLRDRLGPAPLGAPQPASPGTAVGWRREVHLALIGLGWTAGDASAAVAAIEPQAATGGAGCRADGTPDVAALLRLALRVLDRRTLDSRTLDQGTEPR